jgi:hypothetical protein
MQIGCEDQMGCRWTGCTAERLLLLEGGRRVRVGLLAGLVVKRGITNGERGSETFLAITLLSAGRWV